MASATFVTCVADPARYARTRASIEALRGGRLEVALRAVDNTSNQRSAAEALNAGWAAAETTWVVFCHEDVEFPPGWGDRLLEAVETAGERFPRWAILGPMGRKGKEFRGHAAGMDGSFSRFGPLPDRVDTVDEMCLLVRRELPLRFDEALGGFHLYSADLCLQCLEAGWDVVAIDAPVTHRSTTRHRPAEYHRVKRRLQRKWMFGRRRVGSSIGTTCGRIRFGLLEGWF